AASNMPTSNNQAHDWHLALVEALPQLKWDQVLVIPCEDLLSRGSITIPANRLTPLNALPDSLGTADIEMFPVAIRHQALIVGYQRSESLTVSMELWKGRGVGRPGFNHD
ncbi:MAG: hypothetical protein KC561_18785, partial [Myxococcales bacterium]|nr:hypothetical protein [Myxococcales bacterium]